MFKEPASSGPVPAYAGYGLGGLKGLKGLPERICNMVRMPMLVNSFSISSFSSGIVIGSKIGRMTRPMMKISLMMNQ
jgi:hypothetical protein